MLHTIAHWLLLHGYGVIFGIFAVGIIGVPVPNDLLLAYLGHFIYKGKLLPVPTVLAVLFGSICGMTFNYLLGKTAGLYLAKKYGSYIRLTPEKIMNLRDWFEHRGRWALLFSNFLPGVRHLTPIAAGTSKMTFVEFAAFSFTGTAAWVALYISLGYFLQEEWSRQTARIHHLLVAGSVTALILVGFYLLWKRRQTRENGQGNK